MIKNEVISAFREEFSFIQQKFEVLDLLENCVSLDYEVICNLKLPSNEYNIIWHPGVYVFIGNNRVYRIGVSMRNSRARVMQHLEAFTSKDGYGVWDINKFTDKCLLLINVKEISDRHWLLAIEAYLEEKFNPLIKAARIG